MDRIGKFMTICLFVLGFLLCFLVLFFFRGRLLPSDKTQTGEKQENVGASRPATVDPEGMLPENLKIGRKVPEAVFLSQDGSSVTIEDLIQPGKTGVWVSFLPQETVNTGDNFPGTGQMAALADAYNFTLVLTGASAEDAASAVSVSDANGDCARSWGIKAYPADILLDKNGIVLAYHAGDLNTGEAEGLLQRVQNGRAAVNLAFIEPHMSNGKGGCFTNTAQKGTSPSGKDVLSESQGLMMMAALAKNDRDLFDRTWRFTKENLMKNGIAAWYVSADGKTAGVNAFLDDLRIWHALYQAGDRFGSTEYNEDAARMLSAIKELCLDGKGRPVDFTELATGSRADSISLQYLDLEALQAMAQADPEMEKVYQSASDILQDGRISDEFPLYYRNYNYTTRTYDPGNLNAAEALYTLWNLSRVGSLPADTLDWLREKVLKNELGARYRTNGEVVAGYDYHSTAVYGLAALIAHEVGDEDLFETAVRRMERKLVLDRSDAYFGAYTEKGAVIYSFDQLIPLLVNIAVDEEIEDGRE